MSQFRVQINPVTIIMYYVHYAMFILKNNIKFNGNYYSNSKSFCLWRKGAHSPMASKLAATS